MSCYNIEEIKSEPPSIMMVDNQAMVKMSKSLKITSKTRHVARRWHFVRSGQQQGLFKLVWLKGELQLADDMTKLQTSKISLKHFGDTLVKIPEKIKGHKSNTVKNR